MCCVCVCLISPKLSILYTLYLGHIIHPIENILNAAGTFSSDMNLKMST